MKTLKDLSKDEQLRYMEDQRFKEQVERNSMLGEARRKGLKEGSKETAEKIALNMLNEKYSAESISKVTGLSEKEIQQISK